MGYEGYVDGGVGIVGRDCEASDSRGEVWEDGVERGEGGIVEEAEGGKGGERGTGEGVEEWKSLGYGHPEVEVSEVELGVEVEVEVVGELVHVTHELESFQLYKVGKY